MRRWDFEAAYLQGELEMGETIDCSAPPGHATTGGDGDVVVWRAQRPVYGMAQAGRRWQRSLYPWLLEFGLRQSEADPSVFYMRTTPDAHRHEDASMAADVLYVSCYVDDLFILYKHDRDGSLYDKFTTALKQRWRVEDEGPITDLLNIETEREGDTITLKQASYITKLSREYFPDGPPAHIHAYTVPRTMDIRECIIEATADGAAPADPALATRYKRLVGALLYCATQTRPDVSYPVSMLCRAMPRPTTALMDAALRVLASLNKHKQVGLRYQHGTQRRLEGYSDADWAVQRSQSGFVFTLGRASISWGSKRQPVVALSTCESELMAATEAAKEAVHLRRLHAELTFENNPPPTHLHLDNMGAIDTAYNHSHHSRMKHCDRKVF